MARTVVQHVLSRLHQLGITDVFGVPGDYAFPLNDAVCAHEKIRWIGNCNELNAAYAGDGYARIRGLGAVCTTYGVGELSAINGIAGAYAEHLPVFHLVGVPGLAVQQARALMHHTLGNGEFDLFHRMTEPVVCARTILTPENCLAETERLIAAALYHRRPVYMAFPANHANQLVQGVAPEAVPIQSDPATLEAAVGAIVEKIGQARTACILPGVFVARFGLRWEATAVVDASGLPFATMFMDKGVLEETHPAYIGMYDGQFSDLATRDFVESCDCILWLGALLTDFNSGAFTARIERSRSVSVMHHHVRVGSAVYENVEMKDVLLTLARRLPRRTDIRGPQVCGLGLPRGSADERITAEYLYPRWSQFLRPNDILVAETGTCSMGLGPASLPAGATFQNQTLWGSIGWATPAAFGAAVAEPARRTVLITGEGAHQFTAQEVGQFQRYGLKPVIFVLNNAGYLIERLLCKDPDIAYNDLARWNYPELPRTLGCEGWYTARVTTCGELDRALARAETCASGVYIEVVTEKDVAPPMAMKFHEFFRGL